jgi:rubrerythrin
MGVSRYAQAIRIERHSSNRRQTNLSTELKPTTRDKGPESLSFGLGSARAGTALAWVATHDPAKMSKEFTDLDEREILALAIALEEEDSRIYRDFAEKLKTKHPATASVLESMWAEEISHHARLLATFKQRHGDHIPFVRRQDVKGFVKRRPMWLNRILQPRRVLRTAMAMEAETRRFYREAADTVTSVDLRELLIELADAEEDHQDALVDLTKAKKSAQLED